MVCSPVAALGLLSRAQLVCPFQPPALFIPSGLCEVGGGT